jgi:hypothetical protein
MAARADRTARCYKRHMRKLWQAIRRLISVSWLVAAPLVVVIGIIILGLLLWLTSQIFSLLFGAEAVDSFIYDFGILMGMLFWVAIIGVPVYAIVCYIKSRRT